MYAWGSKLPDTAGGRPSSALSLVLSEGFKHKSTEGGGRGNEKTFPSNPPFTSYITIHSMNTLDQIYTSYQTSTAPVLTTTKNFVQANWGGERRGTAPLTPFSAYTIYLSSNTLDYTYIIHQKIYKQYI